MTTKNVMENIQIEKFDPLASTQEKWQQFHEYRRIRSKEKNPDDPISDNESFEKALQANVQFSENELHMYTIYDIKTDKQVGFFVCARILENSASYEATKHLVQFDVELLKDYRQKGIGRKAMKIIYDYAIEHGKKILMTSSDEMDGREFLKKMGAKEALAGVENRLTLKSVNWEMVQQWAKDGFERNPTSKLEFYYSIPEEIIEDYCKVYSEVTNQQPLGELEVGDMIISSKAFRELEKMFADMGRTWITAVTFESDNKISGLTEMRYNPSRETFITQLLTGVQKEYRGRGLGKWLKAEMLLKIKEEFPKVKIVTTSNASSNAPMLSINDRLGFKIYKESVNAQLTVEQLAEFLSI